MTTSISKQYKTIKLMTHNKRILTKNNHTIQNQINVWIYQNSSGFNGLSIKIPFHYASKDKKVVF